MDLTKVISRADKIKNISYQEFSDKRVFYKIKNELIDPEYLWETGKTIKFSVCLEDLIKKYSKLKDENPELYNNYQKIKKTLEIFAIPAQTNEKLDYIFRHYIIFSVKNNINLLNRINNLFLVNDFFQETCKNIRDTLLNAMINNKEKLGDKNILIKNEKVGPYIGNWLFDYRLSYSEDNQKRTSLKRSEYINQSNNSKILNSEEKIMLLRILNIYDYILSPPRTIDDQPITYEFDPARVKTSMKFYLSKKNKELNDYEEINFDNLDNYDIQLTDQGVRIMFGEEEVSVEKEDIVKTRDITDKIRKSLNKYQALMKSVKNQESDIIKSSEKNVEKIKSGLFEDIKQGKAEKVAAGFLILSRLGEMNNINQAEEFKQIFKEKILPLLKKQMPQMSVEKQIENFDNNSRAKIYTKIFIKYALSKVFADKLETGAYLATALENIFTALGEKEMLGMAYFDLKSESYQWAEASLDNGKLILK